MKQFFIFLALFYSYCVNAQIADTTVDRFTGDTTITNAKSIRIMNSSDEDVSIRFYKWALTKNIVMQFLVGGSPNFGCVGGTSGVHFIFDNKKIYRMGSSANIEKYMGKSTNTLNI